jgi:hypothetical protein
LGLWILMENSLSGQAKRDFWFARSVNLFVIAGETVKDEGMFADYRAAVPATSTPGPFFCPWSRSSPRLVGVGDSRPVETLQ